MSFIELDMASAPGMIFGIFDTGGMVLDRNTGELVEAWQIVLDPLHLMQFDILEQDNLGALRLSLSEVYLMMHQDEFFSEEDADDGSSTLVVHRFVSHDDELAALIAAQAKDYQSTHQSIIPHRKNRDKKVGVSLDGGFYKTARRRDRSGPRGK